MSGDAAGILMDTGNIQVEKRSSGVAFDLVMAPATCDSPVRPPSPAKPRLTTTEEIAEKLKAAEERRKSIEDARLRELAQKRAKEEEARAAKQAQSKSFSDITAKALEAKMEANKENKEAQINEMRNRIKNHEEHILRVRQLADNIQQQVKEKAEKEHVSKHSAAQERRQEELQKTLERLKEHISHVDEVRKQSDDFRSTTEEKVIHKMEVAISNREAQLRAIQEKLQEHDKHVEAVRRQKSEQMAQGTAPSKSSCLSS